MLSIVVTGSRAAFIGRGLSGIRARRCCRKSPDLGWEQMGRAEELDRKL